MYICFVLSVKKDKEVAGGARREMSMKENFISRVEQKKSFSLSLNSANCKLKAFYVARRRQLSHPVHDFGGDGDRRHSSQLQHTSKTTQHILLPSSTFYATQSRLRDIHTYTHM